MRSSHFYRILLPVTAIIYRGQCCRNGSPNAEAASTILGKVITSISEIEDLQQISSYTFTSSSIYRSQTLTQNYNLEVSDQSVAEAGVQTLSFREKNNVLQERIDRSYTYNDYWIWAFPSLRPSINYSLVIQDGPQSFACFNQGQNAFFASDPTIALGFVDSYLTDYLIHQSHQFALPWLLKRFLAVQDQLLVYEICDTFGNVATIALEDKQLGLSLLVDEHTYIPLATRTHEIHATLGNCTSDVVFTNYSRVALPSSNGSILLPHRIQTIYNSVNVLEDFVVDQIGLNPQFPTDFFDAKNNSQHQSNRSAPLQSKEYPRSEVHEFYEAGLWSGPFGDIFNTSSVHVDYPISNFTKVRSIYVGYPDYVQMLVEFEDGLLVTDAAPHRSKILIDWVQQNMGGKRLKYVVPSHHHRDHAGGVGDYAAIGAKVVVPHVAREFYKNVNGGHMDLITYSEEAPFVLKDQHVQFRSFWHSENPHARDWTYALASVACPNPDSEVVLFNADVVSPGSNASTLSAPGMRWDIGLARQWLVNAVSNKIPRSSIVLGAHGSTTDSRGVSNIQSLEEVIEITGFQYPMFSPQLLGDDRVCK